MNENNHGGKREGAGSGGARPGPHPGRPPQSFTFKLGDPFFMGLTDAEGRGVGPGVVLVVEAITRTHLTLRDMHNGDRYEFIR